MDADAKAGRQGQADGYGLGRFRGYGALVTGGGRGIGAATVRRLAAEGARVLVADVDEDAARETADAVEGAVALRCDAADTASVEAAVAYAVETFGTLDVLVGNALGPTGDVPSVTGLTDELWHRALDVTLTGALRCARAALPQLAASGRGAIVHIGSINADQSFGGHAYSAAKGALASLTRTLADEAAAHGVRVNQINPGTIRTRAWAGREDALKELAEHAYPLGRVGEPEDVAAAVAFLASADAAWITGTTLRVDGGITAVNTSFTRAGGRTASPGVSG
ncbi:SDR family oxidoreductase [Streptomyces sp. NPDC046887]|uniref:SDR family NAD(P)-dependent oxidoreductase n=1 Tax=Streptomyces sp. NPDC046887 TaxID=3155472 RepID=UPI0033CDD0A1